MKTSSGWWFQPISKIFVKLDHFPKWWFSKNSNHHLVIYPWFCSPSLCFKRLCYAFIVSPETEIAWRTFAEGWHFKAFDHLKPTVTGNILIHCSIHNMHNIYNDIYIYIFLYKYIIYIYHVVRIFIWKKNTLPRASLIHPYLAEVNETIQTMVVDPIIYQVLYIPGGCIVGFLPATVGRFLYFWTFENPWWRFCFNHPKSGQIGEKVQSQTNDPVTNYSGKKKKSEFPTPMNRKNQISLGMPASSLALGKKKKKNAKHWQRFHQKLNGTLSQRTLPTGSCDRADTQVSVFSGSVDRGSDRWRFLGQGRVIIVVLDFGISWTSCHPKA